MINNKPYTPSSIGDIKFRIPLYQRPYSWEQAQVKQLLEDLYAASKSKQHYFIGIMSVCQTESDLNRYDLIDGQQRITTLMLIGKALKDKYDCWKTFMEDRLELYGRKEDSDYLNSFGENPNPKMRVAVEAVNGFLEKTKELDKDKFSTYIYEHTAFFLSEIPSDYSLIDKNNHFVRMNHRGKQLEQADILKVKLGSKLDKEIDQKKFFERWNKWAQLGCGKEKEQDNDSKDNSIMEIIKDPNKSNTLPERSVNYESIVSFPEFLLIALDRFLNRFLKQEEPKIKYQKDKLLSNFGLSNSDDDNKFWDTEKVASFLDFVDKQYELFVRFFIRKDKTERYTWFSINEEFTEELDSSDWNKLKMFQSYMYVSCEPHIWMNAAFDWLDENIQSKENFPINFLQKLKKIDNEKHVESPSLEEFKYESIGNYWFRRLDYYLWEEIFNGKSDGELTLEDNRNFQLLIDKKDVCGKFVFRNNSPSVEHLHPRDESQCNDKWNSKSDIDGFGNLALISQGLNSYQSNKPIEEKFGKLENILKSSNGVLDSVKLYLMYKSAKANQGRWTPELAKVHGEKMIEFLKSTYLQKQ